MIISQIREVLLHLSIYCFIYIFLCFTNISIIKIFSFWLNLHFTILFSLSISIDFGFVSTKFVIIFIFSKLCFMKFATFQWILCFIAKVRILFYLTILRLFSVFTVNFGFGWVDHIDLKYFIVPHEVLFRNFDFALLSYCKAISIFQFLFKLNPIFLRHPISKPSVFIFIQGDEDFLALVVWPPYPNVQHHVKIIFPFLTIYLSLFGDLFWEFNFLTTM